MTIKTATNTLTDNKNIELTQLEVGSVVEVKTDENSEVSEVTNVRTQDVEEVSTSTVEPSITLPQLASIEDVFRTLGV